VFDIMADRTWESLRIQDIQPWYDAAQGGEIHNPYTWAGMGSDADLKAEFIKKKALQLFEKDAYKRMMLEKEWDKARGTPTPTPVYEENVYVSDAPATVGEGRDLLERLLNTPTPTPTQTPRY
jgi:hypothetical protein